MHDVLDRVPGWGRKRCTFTWYIPQHSIAVHSNAQTKPLRSFESLLRTGAKCTIDGCRPGVNTSSERPAVHQLGTFKSPFEFDVPSSHKDPGTKA